MPVPWIESTCGSSGGCLSLERTPLCLPWAWLRRTLVAKAYTYGYTMLTVTLYELLDGIALS